MAHAVKVNVRLEDNTMAHESFRVQGDLNVNNGHGFLIGQPIIRGPETSLYPQAPPPGIACPPVHPWERATSAHLGHAVHQEVQSPAFGATPSWTAREPPAAGLLPQERSQKLMQELTETRAAQGSSQPPERLRESRPSSPTKYASAEMPTESSAYTSSRNEDKLIVTPKPSSARGLHWSTLLGETGTPSYLNSMTNMTPAYLNPNPQVATYGQVTPNSRPIVDLAWAEKTSTNRRPSHTTDLQLDRAPRVFM